MALPTATNQETGETVVLVDGQWQKAERTASNGKGENAYLVGGKWLTDSMPAGAPTKPPAATTADRAMAGFTGANRGIAGLLGLPVDTVENALNLGIAAYGAGKQALTGEPGPELLRGSIGGSESIAKAMEAAGASTSNPRPDDAASRMAHTAGVIAGGSILPGARPAAVAAQAASGATAGEVLGPEYAGVGAMLPAATVGGVNAAKTAIAERVAPRMKDFKQAGSTPSVGQATEFNFLQGFENLLSKFPGGQGVFRKFADKQQEQLGNTAKTGVSAEDAGRSIEKGIKGEGGFIARSKDTWKQLDDAVAAKVPQGTAFAPTNTTYALGELTTPVAGAERTTKALVNPKLTAIRESLEADLQANNGKIPFEALRAIRTKVGAMIDDSIVSGVASGEAKKLYAGLSKDLEAAATQAGASKEFARQNDYYKARMDRIEGTLERVLGKTPEETFARFMPKDANQVTTVRATMRSLDPEQRKVVQEAVVDRLGRATPGRQDATGEVFSPDTFLTNWNKMSEGAKAQIFHDPVVRKNMDALASVADNIKGGAKVYANPSGTTAATVPLGIGYLVGSGNLATGGALIAGSHVGAKMMTSPKVVEWLAQYPKVSPEAAPLHLARLGVIYNETTDPQLKEELSRFVSSVK